jgi:hypothetical protein
MFFTIAAAIPADAVPPSYEVTVGNGTGAPGSTGNSVAITAASLPSDLAGFQIYIKYNKNILTPDTASLAISSEFSALTNAAWTKGAFISSVDATYNRLNIQLYDGNIAGSTASASAVTICSINFSVAAGANTLNNTLEAEATSPGLADTSGNPVPTTWVSGNFQITGIPTGTIALTADPASITADGASTSTITSTAIKDAAGNNVPNGTKIFIGATAGTIIATDADAAPGIQVATTDGAITFALQSTTAAGTATVNAASIYGDAAGSTTVTFTAGAVSAANSTVTVDTNTAAVGTNPASDGITVTVTLKDANNNPVANTEVVLSATGSGNYINGQTEGNGPATIGTTNASGVAIGKILSTKAEAKIFSAAGGATAITQTQAVTFTPLAAQTLQVTGITDPVTAGVASAATVTAYDQFNNIATGYTGTVHFTSSDAQALIPNDYIFQAGDNGAKTFAGGITLKTAGEQTVTATDTVNGALTGSQTGITVNPAAASTLIINQQPASAAAGTAIAPAVSVRIEDDFGNLVDSTASVAIAIANNPGSGTLSGMTSKAATSGVATFSDLSIDKAGTGYTLAITSGVLTGATTNAFNISPADAARLAYSLQPTNTTAGVAISPAVAIQIEDQYGNLVNSTATVTIAIAENPGSGTLSGTAAQAAVAGVATFNDLSIEKAGTGYTLAASSAGLTGATSATFDISPAAASKLGLTATRTTLASDAKGSAILSAQVQDTYGNNVAQAGTTVSFTITDTTYVNAISDAQTDANGLATATITTKTGTIPVPPVTTDVTATAAGLTDSAALTFTIVNFSISVTDPTGVFVDGTGVHLVTSGSTPAAATFAGTGGTPGNYRWALASIGEIDSTTADTVNYSAPASLTLGQGEFYKKDTLTLTDATNQNLIDTIDIYVYQRVAFTMGAATYGITTGGTFKPAVTGGTGQYTFQSSNAAVATVAADGTITAAGPGTCTIEVRDTTYGVFGTDNGFRALTPTIEVIAPIQVTGAAVLDSGATTTFTAQGGTGTFVWEASDGAIDPATGEYTAPAVASGNLPVTIIAYDATYGKTSASPVTGTAPVTIYAPISMIETPAGYDPDTPSTFPFKAHGGTTTLTAKDANRLYDWEIKDWNDAVILSQTTGAATYTFNHDDLFNASGAGVYTVSLKDKTNPALAGATLKIRIPMKFVAAQFGSASGTYYIGTQGGTDTFTVLGGPVGVDVYIYDALDLTGIPVKAANCGTLVDISPTDETNDFTFASPVPKATAFKVRVMLDVTSNNADVARLAEAELDEVWSGIFAVIPEIDVSGTVVKAIDGTTPVVGAMVAATHDATLTDTTAAPDGSFTITELKNTGATFKFYIFLPGFISRTATMADIEAGPILLEELAAGSSSISGNATLSVGTGTVSVKCKTLAGDYITNADGVAIEALSNPSDGSYLFPVPAANLGDGPFTLEFRRTGFIFNETLGLGVLTGVNDGSTTANIVLRPVTNITISGTPQDSSDPTGTAYDQVLVEITAMPQAFDGTPAEISVTDSGTSPVINFAGGTWSFVHQGYADFSVTVKADTSEAVRDIGTGYLKEKTWNYVAGTTAPTVTLIANPNITGGTAASVSGDSTVLLPPDGLVGEVKDSVYFVITESDASDAGAATINGSDIVDVTLVDDEGNEVSDDDIARIFITMQFDPTVVTQGTLESETFVIYKADTLQALVSGNGTAVPVGQIILPIDYINGKVTFVVDHLTSFGIGVVPPPPPGPAPAPSDGTTPSSSPAASSSSSDCFINTAACGIAGSWSAMCVSLILMGGVIVCGLLLKPGRKED